MPRSEATIEIALPAAEIFPWLLDPEKRIRWVSGLVSSTPLDETSYREVVVEHGQRVEATATVVRHDPPHALDLQMTGRGFQARASSRLVERDGRTRLTSSLDLRLGGLVRFAGALVGRQTQHSLERSLARLKALLETSGADDADEQPRAEEARDEEAEHGEDV